MSKWILIVILLATGCMTTGCASSVPESEKQVYDASAKALKDVWENGAAPGDPRIEIAMEGLAVATTRSGSPLQSLVNFTGLTKDQKTEAAKAALPSIKAKAKIRRTELKRREEEGPMGTFWGDALYAELTTVGFGGFAVILKKWSAKSKGFKTIVTAIERVATSDPVLGKKIKEAIRNESTPNKNRKFDTMVANVK